MKREFRHENFEEFIKRNADNLRMKAPERVWEKLSGELNKSRRRFGVGLSAFFLVASVFGYLTISTSTHPFRLKEQPLSPQPTTSTSASLKNTRNIKAIIEKASTSRISQRENQQQALNFDHYDPSLQEPVSTAQLTDPENQLAQAEFTPTIVDDYPDYKAPAPSVKQQSKHQQALTAPNTSPWTIESAINVFSEKQKHKKSRFQTQYHFTPTISYRKLSENKSYLRNSSQAMPQPAYSTLYNNVNSMVTHKPALGFELGITEKYSVSQTVRIRAGLQFNINRYDIKAFHAPFALATIALNNPRTATVDSLWTIANYSNVDVSRSSNGSWLQNFSFQVSAPVGVELALKGNEKMQFGIATSVQPTYVLGDRAYMITSDYKRYTQVPWLLRRWNVNTALETFVSYQSGKTRWQVGPQVRYQLLSSFITNYPVKENLFDFGLKVGVSVNK